MGAQFGDGKDEGALRTIGEVGSALEIKPHVLRYWEEQFPTLEPLKRSGNRRYYRPEDIALIETINRLVNVEGYTIKGARAAIEEGRAEEGRANDSRAEDSRPDSGDASAPRSATPEIMTEEASLPDPVQPDTPAQNSTPDTTGAAERAPRSAAANTDQRVEEAIAELRDIRTRLEAAIAA